MGDTRVTARPDVTVAKKELPPDLQAALIDLEICHGLRRPATLKIVFNDPYFELFDATKMGLGDIVKVGLRDDVGGSETAFQGEITAVGVEGGGSSGVAPIGRFVVEAADLSHRLLVGAKFGVHLAAVDAVIKDIASRNGLTAEITDPGSLKGGKYALQATTDLATLDDLADRHGCTWWVWEDVLHFGQRKALVAKTVLDRRDGSLRTFSATYDGRAIPKNVTVFGHDDANAKKRSSEQAFSASAAMLGTSAPFAADEAAKASDTFGADVQVAHRSGLDADAEKKFAGAISWNLAERGLRGRGVAKANPAIRVGEAVTIEGFGKKVSGDYLVTEVIHRFASGDDLITEFACGVGAVGTASGLPATRPQGVRDDQAAVVAPRAVAGVPSHPVTGLISEVGGGDDFGTVKVVLHHHGKAMTTWARIMSGSAGDDAGIHFAPRVGDEVLVAFINGDPGRPLVLGGVWSKKNTWAAVDGEKANARNTLQATGGNAVELFGDDHDHDGVVVRTKGSSPSKADHMIVVSASDSLVKDAKGKGPSGVVVYTATGDIALIAGDAKVTIENSGDMKIETPGDLEIKANNITIEAGMKLSFKSGTDAKLEAGTKLDVKAAAAATIDGGAKLDIKGILVNINS